MLIKTIFGKGAMIEGGLEVVRQDYDDGHKGDYYFREHDGKGNYKEVFCGRFILTQAFSAIMTSENGKTTEVDFWGDRKQLEGK